MIKVAIDSESRRLAQKTGHGVYVENLCQGLEKLPGIKLIFCEPPFAGPLNTLKRMAWDQFYLPLQARKAKADLIHLTAFSLPIFSSRPLVVTVHDLSLRKFPTNMKGISGWFLRIFVPWTFKRAVHLIAVSEATKKDLQEILKVDDKKITVIPLAVSDFFRPSPSDQKNAVMKKYDLKTEQFILFVGTLEPRKNLPFLIRSITPFLKEHPEYKLVLAGKRGWLYEEIFTTIQKSEVGGQVIETGFISDEEKRALYSAAAVFCYPSLYEGFGLPILEAFACSCPVITADNSSLPEVAGEAAYVLPLHEEAWRLAISELCLSTVQREKYREKGRQRLKMFSWQQTALATAEVYKLVAKQKKS